MSVNSPFVSSVLGHVALEISINVVRVVTCNAARFLLIAWVLSRHHSLWTLDGLVLGAILGSVVGAFLMIRISTIHATYTIPDGTPKKIAA